MEMSLVGTSLFILSRRLDPNSGNQSRGLDPSGVCTCSSPWGCKTHGGPRPKVWSPHPCSPLRWSWGVSGPLEKPSDESGGLSTRGGSEGQVEHPDGDGCGMQWSVVLWWSLVSVHGRTPGGVLMVVQEVSWGVGSGVRSRTRSWSVWSDWWQFQIELGDRSIAVWWTTGVGSCFPIDLWPVPRGPLDENWSLDGSYGVSDSGASLRILTHSLPLVVNEPLFDRFFFGDLFCLTWGNSLVSQYLWGLIEI